MRFIGNSKQENEKEQTLNFLKESNFNDECHALSEENRSQWSPKTNRPGGG